MDSWCDDFLGELSQNIANVLSLPQHEDSSINYISTSEVEPIPSSLFKNPTQDLMFPLINNMQESCVISSKTNASKGGPANIRVESSGKVASFSSRIDQ